MFESLIALSQMTRTTLAINELKKNNLPYIVVLTDPTAGGISASFAMLGDITFAEPGALVAFAGKRVIQATVKEELPEILKYLINHPYPPQYIGFIVNYPKSKRFVEYDKLLDLLKINKRNSKCSKMEN